MNSKGSSVAYTLLTLVVMVAITLIGIMMYKMPKVKPSEAERHTKTAPGQSEHIAADTVGLNGKIYTSNSNQPWAEAVAIKGTDIVYVGDNKGVKAFIGDKTTVDFGISIKHGCTLIIGFWVTCLRQGFGMA